MRTQILVVTATMLAAAAAVACTGASGGSETMAGMRVDGTEVACSHEGDGISRCAPSAPGSAASCDSVTVLWPPNHKMVQFTLADCAPPPGCGDGGGGDGSGSSGGSGSGGGSGGGSGSGSGGGAGSGSTFAPIARTAAAGPTAASSITSITADEEVEVGAGGDGHTTRFDIQIIDGATFALRSERQGGGDGRVYRVNFADPMTGQAGSCEFDVPHDQGPAHGAIDSGAVVTVLR
jgi:hypothetical protein